jgi:hypothetical protein
MAGMLVLLAAVGTATAPVALAAPGDLCAIEGPFPVVETDQIDLDGHDIDGKLLVGETYLFLIYVEDNFPDGSILDEINVEIDDEEGDADITSFGLDDDGTPLYLKVAGVDVLPGVSVEDFPFWDGTLDDLAPEFGFTPDDDVCGDSEDPDGIAIVDVSCEDPGRFEMTAYDPVGPDNAITGEYLCVAPPSAATLTATPTTVESSPALGNISHSLLVLTLTDADGKPAAPGSDVDWTTDRCRIDGLTEDEYEDNAPGGYALGVGALFGAYSSTDPATAGAIEETLSGHTGFTGAADSISFENDSIPGPVVSMRTIAAAVLHCEGAAPGVANIKAEIERTGADLAATATVTVVGPPAFITMTAAPNRLVCGEKATILVTVTDAINQKVSDHTRVELITNHGGVIGGTGSSLFFQNVNPLSSSVAETFGGVATAYLLTSTEHVGAYEVVAAAGGSLMGAYSVLVGDSQSNDNGRVPVFYNGNTGVFSTPVVTSQVTVTCTVAAPAVTAPSTGTGTISPPNTGDAGLAAGSSSTAMLYVIAGAVAFALAGLAGFSYARR